MKYALILAGGSGNRMGQTTPKQFIEFRGEPMFVHSVRTFQPLVDKIVLVTREEDIGKTKDALKEAKLSGVSIVAGGRERYLSAVNGLRSIYTKNRMAAELQSAVGITREREKDIVLIHDAARPLITEEIIRTNIADTEKYGAAIVAVPVKDTMKVVDEDLFVTKTLNRKKVWSVQTPQGFDLSVIGPAYEKLMENPEVRETGCYQNKPITDDAMVVENFSDARVHITEGSYENLKVTTPEDLKFIQALEKAEKIDK